MQPLNEIILEKIKKNMDTYFPKMKYMHFNSSCSYAGLANMLALLGHESEDVEIALAMGLPYFLSYEEETRMYLAGAMLQSKEWFELYLKPRGFQFVEQLVFKKEVIEQLRTGMMLGMQVSPQSKHAMIFLENTEEGYVFLNNKREDSVEEERMLFTKEEFLERVPDKVVLGWLEKCETEEVDKKPYFEKSLRNWERLQEEIQEFVAKETTPQELRQAMNRLFRPLLVDGLTMVELLGEQELITCLKGLQTDFLKAVRKNEVVRLSEEMDCSRFDKGINGMKALIRKQLR